MKVIHGTARMSLDEYHRLGYDHAGMVRRVMAGLGAVALGAAWRGRQK